MCQIHISTNCMSAQYKHTHTCMVHAKNITSNKISNFIPKSSRLFETAFRPHIIGVSCSNEDVCTSLFFNYIAQQFWLVELNSELLLLCI